MSAFFPIYEKIRHINLPYLPRNTKTVKKESNTMAQEIEKQALLIPRELTEDELTYIRNRSESDIKKTRESFCSKCIYLGGSSIDTVTRGSRSTINTYCNYIGMTGHRRPCLAGKCKETGVFVQKTQRRGKRKAETAAAEPAEVASL